MEAAIVFRFNALMSRNGEFSVRFNKSRESSPAQHASSEVSVSFWSTILVREEPRDYNADAKQIGEWSRLVHPHQCKSQYGNAIGDVWFNLFCNDSNANYKNLIQDVTTSRLRNLRKDKRAIQLIFRYSEEGAWQNHSEICTNVHIACT